jgi:hypothetical protein
MISLVVIQYGYLALFAPAFSLAPLIALVNNIITIRIDANKFCSQIRRPTFRVSEDIGAWFAVLNAMGFIALLTNVAMIAFVGSQLSRGEDRVISDCHFSVQLNHFIPGFLSYSIPVFLK